MSDISSRKVLIVVHDWGIEETELTRPLEDLREAGAQVTLAAPTLENVETLQHDRYPGATLAPDALLSDVQASDYDLLVVPGGTCNVDHLRINSDAIKLAKDFAAEGKPIAAICHGPWLLVNAEVLGGKTLTSCRYIKADVENAGGVHEDRQVVVDDASGWKLITSRKPDDLDAFVAAIKQAL
jgi:protease I